MTEIDFNKIFAKRLKHYLVTYDMTQKDLADKLNVSATTVSNWVLGTKSPRMNKVDAMCSLFHCKRSDLIEDKAEDEYDKIDIDVSSSEYTHLKKYRVLDNHGKDLVDMVLDKEYNRVNKPTVEYDRFEPIAAHQRTDIEVTDEMIQHDNDLMDNFDNF